MADEGSPHPKPKSHTPEGRLDLRDVKRLAHLMDVHGLAELELEDVGRRVHLRKGGVADGRGVIHVPMAAAPMPAPSAAAPAAPAAPSAPAAAKGIEIRSPMVGTFYRSPSPEAAPFAEVGDAVRNGSVVCIIEAMKVMNEIKSEVEGEILAVLAQNGEAVEFDQPLFLVRPPGAA
jgi:acetyl-CoA carboxylase biotin carboxyl carrier protein